MTCICYEVRTDLIEFLDWCVRFFKCDQSNDQYNQAPCNNKDKRGCLRILRDHRKCGGRLAYAHYDLFAIIGSRNCYVEPIFIVSCAGALRYSNLSTNCFGNFLAIGMVCHGGRIHFRISYNFAIRIDDCHTQVSAMGGRQDKFACINRFRECIC